MSGLGGLRSTDFPSFVKREGSDEDGLEGGRRDDRSK